MGRSKFKRRGQAKFLMIDGHIVKSAAWQNLSPNDKATYLEIKWAYDGLNNGRIGLSCREVAAALRISKNTAALSFASLEDKGFIVRMKLSGFNVKSRTATEWRLTEYKCDVSGHLPTKEYMRWRPEEKITVLSQVRTVLTEGQLEEFRRLKHA